MSTTAWKKYSGADERIGEVEVSWGRRCGEGERNAEAAFDHRQAQAQSDNSVEIVPAYKSSLLLDWSLQITSNSPGSFTAISFNNDPVVQRSFAVH